MTIATTAAGDETRFDHGGDALGHDLQLDFVDRTADVLAAIRAHNREQSGGHISFRLPAIIWQGHSSAIDVVPLYGRWKYAEPPSETHGKNGLHNISVRLVYVGDGPTS